MKNLIRILSFYLLCCFLISFCAKENEEDIIQIIQADLKGTWVNKIVPADTIVILDSVINRWDVLSRTYAHFYRFDIRKDSIIIDYTGLYKIGTPQYHSKIYLSNNKDTLIIQNFSSVYPGYKGDVFLKISK